MLFCIRMGWQGAAPPRLLGQQIVTAAWTTLAALEGRSEAMRSQSYQPQGARIVTFSVGGAFYRVESVGSRGLDPLLADWAVR